MALLYENGELANIFFRLGKGENVPLKSKRKAASIDGGGNQKMLVFSSSGHEKSPGDA